MQEVLPLLHSPRGCGFHYRYSARRRHQPFYSVLTSNLEERDIICGGEEKLRQAIRDAWSRYRPGLIMVIPSPISDILNEDVRSVCAELRREGISVVGVQSELFLPPGQKLHPEPSERAGPPDHHRRQPAGDGAKGLRLHRGALRPGGAGDGAVRSDPAQRQHRDGGLGERGKGRPAGAGGLFERLRDSGEHVDHSAPPPLWYAPRPRN